MSHNYSVCPAVVVTVMKLRPRLRIDAEISYLQTFLAAPPGEQTARVCLNLLSLCVWLGKRHPVVLDADHADAIETLQEQHDVTCWSAAGQIHLKTLQTQP